MGKGGRGDRGLTLLGWVCVYRGIISTSQLLDLPCRCHASLATCVAKSPLEDEALWLRPLLCAATPVTGLLPGLWDADGISTIDGSWVRAREFVSDLLEADQVAAVNKIDMPEGLRKH